MKPDVRLAVVDDRHYILKTWREQYGRHSHWSRKMMREVYHRHHRRLIEQLMDKDPTVVASNPRDNTHVLGFACGARMGGEFVAPFVCVRHELQRYGLATEMLRALSWDGSEPIVVTHWVPLLDEMPERFRFVYNPYLLFEQFREIANGGSHSTETRATA